MAKITSFKPYNCEWCSEIRRKYRLRQKIAKKLNMSSEVQGDFKYYSEWAKCPFHKTTAYFGDDLRKSEITIRSGEIIVKWWTSSYTYELTFNLIGKTVSWWTDHQPSSNFDFSKFDFEKLFIELLTLMSKEQLKSLEKAISELEKTEEYTLEYILAKFEDDKYLVNTHPSDDMPTIEVDGKEFRVEKEIYLKCKDKPLTSKIQGFREFKDKLIYKKGASVYLLKTDG